MKVDTERINNMEIKLITQELNGKKIVYSPETMFYVEVGNGKGSYKPRTSVKGNLAQAVMYFRCINIGNGCKKRLLMNDKVIVRHFSWKENNMLINQAL